MAELFDFEDQNISVNPSLCLLCQKRKNQKDKLSSVGENGKTTLLKSAIARFEAKDAANILAIRRVNVALKDVSVDCGKFGYHRGCYSVFTSTEKIEALARRKLQENLPACSKSNANKSGSSNYVTRSQVQKFDKTKCILCQKDNEKRKLHEVMTPNMDATIKDLANYDYNLHLRVTGECDLMAGDALYHSFCIVEFKQEKERLQKCGGDMKTHLPLIQICKEARMAASLGKTLQISSVWERYTFLAKNLDVSILPSFKTRRSTFIAKLRDVLGDVYQFFQPLNRGICEREMLLIPTAFANRATADAFLDGNELELPEYRPDNIENNDFRTLVHAALRIRGELESTPGHNSLDISRESIIRIVPDSLHLFLNVLLNGENALDTHDEDGSEDEDSDDDSDKENTNFQTVMACDPTLSIAQDIVYALSKGKKRTPKHVGLALTLHQATRRKKLVNLFHSAGHCMSYRDVLRADTTLAELALKSMDPNSGAVVPPNFIKYTETQNLSPTLHVTADNIDILTDTLDGKKTFHATQMVGFQRGGTAAADVLQNVTLGGKTVLQLPPVLNELYNLHCLPRIEPQFEKSVELEWFNASNSVDIKCMTSTVKNSRLEDIAFAVSRVESESMVSWTQFHKQLSTNSYSLTAVGYMPLILNPAHELSTLSTVLQRCIALGDKLEKKHIVLTVDQNLHAKLMELRWNSEVFRERIVLRMGGLHIAMNFMKTIGQHVSGCGLSEIWLESGLLAEGSIAKVFEGKAYSKGMRAHKITFQAIWRLLLPSFLVFLEDENEEVAAEFQRDMTDYEALLCFLKSEDNIQYLCDFVQRKCEHDATFALWWSYLDMVLTLLMFTKGIRDGEWECYRASLSEMLPYTARYDHGNYLRSLTVYVADMWQLPPEVEKEFRAGDFGVLRTEQRFSQVDPDQAQEWMVGVGKDSGGVVGITQNVRALQRWALSFYWRTEIAQKTFELYRVQTAVQFNESPGRHKRDLADEEAVLHTMEMFELLNEPHDPTPLVRNVATKDSATEGISLDLLTAKEQGAEQVHNFVSSRLLPDAESGKPSISFHAKVSKNKALTMACLHKELLSSAGVAKKTKDECTDFLHTLVCAYDAGRKIDLRGILKYELSRIPKSLATGSGEMRIGEKSSLVKVLTKGIHCPSEVNVEKSSSILLIDAMALIVSFGKPSEAHTFGDYARCFIRKIKSLASSFSRVDIVFDRYRELSVKSCTRKKRAKGFAPVRREITNASVPLPKDWKSFLLLSENKSDIARFLSEEIARFNFESLHVVVSGGFQDELHVFSNDSDIAVEELSSYQEEADTRIILHAANSTYKSMVIMARDTDVILLLVHHFPKIPTSKVWVMCGTFRDRKYIPIHEVHEKLSVNQVDNILSFHAITGCDTTSKFATITKAAAWKNFEIPDQCKLLDGLGSDQQLSDCIRSNVEAFIANLYKVQSTVSTCDEARLVMFGTVKKTEFLPPTTDAANLHILRAHYQVAVWKTAHLPLPTIPHYEECGWKVEGNMLTPVFTTMDPIPKSCPEFTKCGCKTNCGTRICPCRKATMDCMKICKCQGCCLNRQQIDDELPQNEKRRKKRR